MPSEQIRHCRVAWVTQRAAIHQYQPHPSPVRDVGPVRERVHQASRPDRVVPILAQLRPQQRTVPVIRQDQQHPGGFETGSRCHIGRKS